ncbi:TIMELESS-interacting protein-like [Penaeus japonicus]|uniref:TIMELESS-interacting protein-like n=1 Tax=Penaeus japonicus TaxID=27405 RepID=UPI001C70D8D0|nr:TIMELESS-interacting protein-like [Penaeus japonicus]
MEMDIEEMFGIRPAESERGSASEAEEEEEDDDRGENNPMDEAIEVPEPGQQANAEPVKPKRVIKNPQPKLDVHRLGGPRGIPVLQKSYKDVKWKGKGYEKEDLDVLLKRLEHWAHRLFPKLPFNDVLEQIEKQGFKKPVQVLIKKLRLDMFTESEMNGENPEEDNVRRGIHDEEPVIEEPPVDIFDELLGQNGFPTPQPTTAPAFTSVPSAPTQSTFTLTEEQRERVERNKRLAAERRQARLKQQQEEEERLRQLEEDAHSSFDDIRGSGIVGATSSTQNNKESPKKQNKEDESAKEQNKEETANNSTEDMETETAMDADAEKEEGKIEKIIGSRDVENQEDEGKESASEDELVIEEKNDEEKDLHNADDLLDMIDDE